MDKMINLRDLLVHEVQDLYSAEEQIIAALPKMIEKANNNQLKKALQDHLKVTEKQKDRLDEVKKLLGQGGEEGEESQGKKGLFGLFGGGEQKCKGTEGLIKEGEKVMSHDMTPEVLDAAIIASAQKIEHYEICGYGTARAYARELNLGDVAELLEETLNEEYEADDLLTDLAVGRLNEEAQNAQDDEGEGRGKGRGSRGGSSGGAGNGRSSRSNGASKSASARSNGSGRGSKSASRGASKSGSKSASKGGSKTASKGGSKSASRSGSKSSSGGRSSGSSGGSKGGSRSKSASGRSRSARAKSR
jgi:ferritin-like metal-binding protein YciE